MDRHPSVDTSKDCPVQIIQRPGEGSTYNAAGVRRMPADREAKRASHREEGQKARSACKAQQGGAARCREETNAPAVKGAIYRRCSMPSVTVEERTNVLRLFFAQYIIEGVSGAANTNQRTGENTAPANALQKNPNRQKRRGEIPVVTEQEPSQYKPAYARTWRNAPAPKKYAASAPWHGSATSSACACFTQQTSCLNTTRQPSQRRHGSMAQQRVNVRCAACGSPPRW